MLIENINNKSAIALQANEHSVIDDDVFYSIEEYVLQLMHRSDYKRAQRLMAGKTILDLGCNCGYGTHLLSQTCNHIIGVDVSPRAIEQAQSRYRRDTLSFRVVDGGSLPFETGTFDIVTSFQVLEHLIDYDIYFNEIRRVLKPAGVFLLTTPNADIRVQPGRKPWNRFHMHEFRSVELENLLNGYFPYAKIFGQFASEQAYKIEYNRCLAIRDSVSTPKRRTLKSQIGMALPVWLVNKLKNLRASSKKKAPAPIDELVKKQFSVEDFYYRDVDLAQSLSLLACCSASKVVQREAANAYLS